MPLKKIFCRVCGAPDLAEDKGKFICTYCGTKFEKNVEADKIISEIHKLADEERLRRVTNNRAQLYDKINSEDMDDDAIINLCRAIKSDLPDDFLANFYETAICGTNREFIRLLNDIDVKENYPFIEGIVNYTIRSLTGDLILPLNNLIERTYKTSDIEKYSELQTRAEEEAQKVVDGVYDVTAPRDAFILYSSKDMNKVTELVRTLEDQGLECFVALRNLQHGKGAKAEYKQRLEKAMDYCKCVVFVSSKKSRNPACDAYRIELPYIRNQDISNAPPEFRRDYTRIPMKYKKRRIEYMVEASETQTAADRSVKEFFFGLEYCCTPDEVADRILAFDNDPVEDSNSKKKKLIAQIEELKRQQAESQRQLREALSNRDFAKEERINDESIKQEVLKTEDEVGNEDSLSTNNSKIADKSQSNSYTKLWSNSKLWSAYIPRFTGVSEKYRLRGRTRYLRDTDVFGPKDVNLKRFMLYGERGNMENVIGQMCALFAAAGGPLDFMFSNATKNRTRYKSAANTVIEDDGLSGEVGGKRIFAGSQKYMIRNGIAIPEAARTTDVSIDTTKVLYAAEDGELCAKFYIRYSFSEEFKNTIPLLKKNEDIPIIRTSDPNIDNALLDILTAKSNWMEVVKITSSS